jgi:outer membrane autotransporter protein
MPDGIGAAAGNVIFDAAPGNPFSFTFGNNTNPYTIAVADGITLALADLTVTGTKAVTISAPGTGTMDLAAGVHTFNISVQPNLNTTLSLPISGAGSIDKTGDGALVLSGNNTYSGGTTLEAGSLNVGHDNALGAGGLTINGGNFQAKEFTPVTVGNAITIGGNFAIGGNAALTLSGTVDLGGATRTIGVNNTANTTFSNTISNGGLNINNTGGATLTLSGNNTYALGTTLTAGRLAAGNNSAFGTGGLTINGGTLVASGGARSLSNDVTVGGNVTFGEAGHNELTLSGTVDLGGATRTLTVSNTANTNLTGVISNGGLSINNTGGATITLSGTNTYAGGTTLTAGTLAVSQSSALGSGGLTLNGGTLTNSSGATLTLANNITVGGNFTLDGLGFILGGTVNLGGATRTINVHSNYDHTLSGIVGNGGLNINNVGSGTFILSGANTYADGTNLITGILGAGDNSAFGSGNLLIGGGTLAASGGARSLANNVTVGGNFGIGGTNDLTLSGTVALGAANRTFTVTNTGNTTLSGVISGNAGVGLNINNTGGGLVTLSGANTYTGNTTLTAGTLVAGIDNPFGTAATTLRLENGVTLAASGAARTVDNALVQIRGDLTFGTATANENLTFTGAAMDIWWANHNLTVNNTTEIQGVIGQSVVGSGFTKLGAGTLTLSGANTYTGVTTVTAGTLNLAAGGSITSNLNNWGTTVVNGDVFGNVTNNVDAILRGSGTVTGNLNNSGTVSPGNSVGTLNVAGSFTQAAGGTLEVEIESAVSYDKVAVTGAPGTAAVAGTLKPTLLGGYSPAPNTLLPGIITATGGVTGTFSTIDSALACQLIYNADSIDLLMNLLAPPINPRIVFNYDDPSFPLTGNQRNIGLMFNAVKESASGDLGSVLDIIRQLPGGAAVANAYQQISPDKGSAMPAMSLAGSMMQWRTLNNRLNYLRWSGAEGGGGPTYSIGGSGKLNLSYSSLSGLMLAYNGANLGGLLSGKGKTSNYGNRWGVYTDFVGTMGNQDSSVNQTGYDYNIFGFNSGVDYRLRDNLIIGAGSGYYHTATSFNGSGGSVEVNSIPFYAYGLYYPSSFYAMGSVGYTLNLYGLNRNLRFGSLNRVAESSVTGSQFNISGESGYDFPLRGFILTPAASLYYSKAWVGSYTEKGADALNLKVGAQSADSLQTGVGVRVARPLKVKNTQVVPQASAFYQHEFANDTRGLDARLPQTGTNFSYNTVSPRRDFAVVGAGVAVGLKKNLFVQANYNAEVGRGNSTNHYVSAGLRWEF